MPGLGVGYGLALRRGKLTWIVGQVIIVTDDGKYIITDAGVWIIR